MDLPMKTIRLALLLLFYCVGCNAQSRKSDVEGKKEIRVMMETSAGKIVIKLYNETPRHRDNFVKLVREGFYDGLLFHRVINHFMIQTGDPESRNASPDKMLGTGGSGYTLPAEIVPAYIHKRGAVAAARTGDNVNPLRHSSGSQFYIVQGNTVSEDQLHQAEANINAARRQYFFYRYYLSPENQPLRNRVDSLRKAGNQKALDSLARQVEIEVNRMLNETPPFRYTPEQIQTYTSMGGTPHLDQAYTVFGEVVEGMEVVDKIAASPTGQGDRPLEDIRIISMKIIE